MVDTTTVRFGGGGGFDFTPPSGFVIIPWVFSLLLVVFGLIGSIGGLASNNWTTVAGGGMFVVPGCLLGMWLTPTKLQKEFEKIRIEEKPRDFVHRSETGGSTGSFWTGKYSHSPKRDDRGWVFQAPGPEYWDKVDPYGPDDSGIIPEHPTVVGTPKPASFSLDGVFMCILALYSIPATMASVYAGLEVGESAEDLEALAFAGLLIFGPAIVSVVFAAGMWVTGTKMQLTIDVPTSKIRSMAAGELELVGQVRRWTSPAPPVLVGDDPARTYNDLHSWRWEYEIHLKRTKVVMTDDGPRTKTEYKWETIKQKNGSHNFILHDGTGGVLVKPKEFEDQELGEYIRIWKVDHNRNLGEIFGSLITTTFGGWTILEHKWTLWGLALGDPCYILGKAENRPKNMKKEKWFAEDGITPIRRNDQQLLMQVVGESGVGFDARLERGSELGVLGKVKSQFEYKIIPGILAAGCLIGTYLSYANF
ncbi:MAG: hypothetical protein VYD27_03765 [Candidatus Thermoplasmatota archaeon]|nr:hypothetical protein [Candidatus Thermoplasmatota archaeon]